MRVGDIVYSRDPLTWNLWEITLRVGDLIRYRKLDEVDENESTWIRIKDLTGIVLPPGGEIYEPHIRILWNTCEIHVHFIPPYDPQEHFEVLSECR